MLFSLQAIASALRKDHSDPHRFEKISNIIKQFKLSCRSVENVSHWHVTNVCTFLIVNCKPSLRVCVIFLYLGSKVPAGLSTAPSNIYIATSND